MTPDIPPTWPGSDHPQFDGACTDFGYLFKHGFGKPGKLLGGATSLRYLLDFDVVEVAANGPHREQRLYALKRLLLGYVEGLGEPRKRKLDLTALTESQKAALKEERKPAVLRVLLQLDSNPDVIPSPEGITDRRIRVTTDPDLWPWLERESLRTAEPELRMALASWICELDSSQTEIPETRQAVEIADPDRPTLSSAPQPVRLQPPGPLPPVQLPTTRTTDLNELVTSAHRLNTERFIAPHPLAEFETSLGRFFAARPYLGDLASDVARLDGELRELIPKIDPPLSAFLLLHHARLRDRLGRWHDALKDLEAALDISGAPRGELLVEATAMLLNLGEWVQMGMVAEQALLEDLDSAQAAEVRNWKTWVERDRGRPGEALRQLAPLIREQRELELPTHPYEYKEARIWIELGEQSHKHQYIERARPQLDRSSRGEDPANPFPRIARWGVADVLGEPDREARWEEAEEALKFSGQHVAGHLEKLWAERADNVSEQRRHFRGGLDAWTACPHGKGVFDLSLALGWSLLDASPANPREAATYLYVAVVLGERMWPAEFGRAQEGFVLAAQRLGTTRARLAAQVESILDGGLGMFLCGWSFTVPDRPVVST